MNSAEWTAGEVRAWLGVHRRVRRRDWADWYYLGLAAVLGSAMGISLLANAQLPLWGCAPGAATCLVGLSVVPVLWTAVTIAVVTLLSSLLGPLAVSAAAGVWVLPLPVDRADLLAPDLRRIVLIGAVAGLLSGVMLWLAAAQSPVWIASCGVAGSLAVLAAVLAQQNGWQSLWRLGAVAVTGSVLLGAFGAAQLMPSVVVALLSATVVTVLVWRCWTQARSGLTGMTTSTLVRQGRLRAGLAGAVSTADAGFVLDLIGLRLVGSPTRSRSLNTHARTRWGVLAGYEVRRLILRSPRLLIGFVAVLVIGLAIPAAPSTVLVAASVALVPALALMLTSLRTVVATPGLQRTIGLSPLAQVTALATGAGLATIVWLGWSGILLLVGGLPTGSALLLAWATGASGLAGALRRIVAPPPTFTSGIIMTELGPIPVSALTTALSGFGTAAIVATLMLTGVPPILCAATASLALLWSVRTVSHASRPTGGTR